MSSIYSRAALFCTCRFLNVLQVQSHVENTLQSSDLNRAKAVGFFVEIHYINTLNSMARLAFSREAAVGPPAKAAEKDSWLLLQPGLSGAELDPRGIPSSCAPGLSAGMQPIQNQLSNHSRIGFLPDQQHLHLAWIKSQLAQCTTAIEFPPFGPIFTSSPFQYGQFLCG